MHIQKERGDYLRSLVEKGEKESTTEINVKADSKKKRENAQKAKQLDDLSPSCSLLAFSFVLINSLKRWKFQKNKILGKYPYPPIYISMDVLVVKQ